MTEATTAQINARIAHIRLVYGDADQDAALLEALLKDRGRVTALEDALHQINSITEASFPGATSGAEVAEIQRVTRAALAASQPAQPVAVEFTFKLDTSPLRAMLDEAEDRFAHLTTIAATIRVNAMRQGATNAEVDDFISGKADFVAWMQDRVKPQPLTVQDAARRILSDDIAISHMAQALHDGPLGADDYWFSAARPQGAWCVDAVRVVLRAIAEGLA